MLNGASCAGVVATLLLQRSSALDINVNDHDSIRSAAGIVANDLMSLYVNNGNTTPAYLVGTFAKPVYWWEAGAAWGGMVDYWSYTNDETYVASTKQALLFQAGPSNDFMNDQWKKELGNDDQSFWALTAMTAAEQNFPAADTGNPSWLDMAVRVFESQIARWDTSTCGGGLRWQIYPENNGYNYKNSVSNGGLFQLAARLFRYTGNSTYSDWANRIWDWSTSVDFVDSTYNVYDGASDQDGCDPVDKLQWTYNLGLYLYGTANMWNATEGTVQAWHTRTQGLVDSASIFFGQASNSTNVMYEAACEPNGMCDTDQRSFKAYLSRWMGKTSVLCPWTTSQVLPKLRASAEGAAEACSGGVDGKTCGAKWYIGGFDGITGVGEQLSALEVFDALLAGNSPGPAVQSDSALFANVITVTKSSTKTTTTKSMPTIASSNMPKVFTSTKPTSTPVTMELTLQSTATIASSVPVLAAEAAALKSALPEIVAGIQAGHAAALDLKSTLAGKSNDGDKKEQAEIENFDNDRPKEDEN